jgi:hypothetical protein
VFLCRHVCVRVCVCVHGLCVYMVVLRACSRVGVFAVVPTYSVSVSAPSQLPTELYLINSKFFFQFNQRECVSASMSV